MLFYQIFTQIYHKNDPSLCGLQMTLKPFLQYPLIGINPAAL